MNAHSAARAAGLVLLAGLAAGNVGCRHARRAVDACLPPADCNTPCPPDAKPAAPKVVRHHAPAVKCDTPAAAVKCDADCAPSVVEVRQAPPVHIKVPQQDVIVNMPQQAAPAPPMVPAGVPQMQPTAGGFVAPASSGMMPANVTHVPANRARLGFAFDTIRVRLPIIRPIAIPTVPEATFTMPVQQVAVQPAGFVQPMAVQPVAVQPAGFVQPQAVQPVAVAPAAPQQMQFVQQVAPAAPQQVQLVQPAAPQQVQLVQPAAPQQVQVQMMPLAPQAPVAPAAAPSAQSVNDYCRQVDALMQALEASKRAAGCPPTVLPPR